VEALQVKIYALRLDIMAADAVLSLIESSTLTDEEKTQLRESVQNSKEVFVQEKSRLEEACKNLSGDECPEL
jgi:hypothetical protein